MIQKLKRRRPFKWVRIPGLIVRTVHRLPQPQLKRRYIPFAASIAAGLIVILPVYFGFLEENSADELSLIASLIIFACVSALFGWIRHTLRARAGMELTMFGQALVDFFFALTLFFLVLTVVFTVSYAMLKLEHSAPFLLRMTYRVSYVSSGVLLGATMVGVAWEMWRSGISIAAHRPLGEGGKSRPNEPEFEMP